MAEKILRNQKNAQLEEYIKKGGSKTHVRSSKRKKDGSYCGRGLKNAKRRLKDICKQPKFLM
jgi:hypothetical protein